MGPVLQQSAEASTNKEVHIRPLYPSAKSYQEVPQVDQDLGGDPEAHPLVSATPTYNTYVGTPAPYVRQRKGCGPCGVTACAAGSTAFGLCCGAVATICCIGCCLFVVALLIFSALVNQCAHAQTTKTFNYEIDVADLYGLEISNVFGAIEYVNDDTVTNVKMSVKMFAVTEQDLADMSASFTNSTDANGLSAKLDVNMPPTNSLFHCRYAVVVVTLPKTYDIPEVSMDMSEYGSIALDSIVGVNNVSVNMRSGDILVESLSLVKLNITTTHGTNINVKDVTISQMLFDYNGNLQIEDSSTYERNGVDGIISIVAGDADMELKDFESSVLLESSKGHVNAQIKLDESWNGDYSVSAKDGSVRAHGDDLTNTKEDSHNEASGKVGSSNSQPQYSLNASINRGYIDVKSEH